MMFESVRVEDLSTIAEWLREDSFEIGHKTPEFFYSMNPDPQKVFTSKITDNDGAVLFFRLDKDGRFHTEFAPEAVVPKRRLVKALLEGFPAIVKFAQQMGLRTLVFETKASLLGAFMCKTFGFEKVAGENDDYILHFENSASAVNGENQHGIE